MKKSLLLAAAALFAASNVYALDMYVIGADVDGQSWALGTNKMTQTGEGTYEWTGSKLADKFKINDGTWDAAYNIGAGTGSISLDTPYSYYMGDGSQDISFNGFQLVNNPKIVLDMNAGTITLTGTPGEVEPVEPGDVTFYMIGSNVNGQSWALAQEDAKFTDQGNGIYRWEGNVLGTGFKINDGTWSNPQYNIGGTGVEISMNEPYYYWADGSSGNIAFNGFTELLNPIVELNLNDETITLIGGNAGGEANWYVCGINGVYELTNDWMLSPVEGKDGVFSREVFILETAGVFKVSDDGWAHQYGTNDSAANFIDPTELMVYLDVVNGEGGDVPYELEEGAWIFTFDLNELTATFSHESDGVEMVVMGEGNAVYYNLHGQKVANPTNGIFVKVQNGKAVKVVK